MELVVCCSTVKITDDIMSGPIILIKPCNDAYELLMNGECRIHIVEGAQISTNGFVDMLGSIGRL